MNVDIITIHPRSQDYPMFRSMLEWYTPYYNKAIIAFTGEKHPDYSDFIRESVNPRKVLCLNARPHQGAEDWRNLAVHDALSASSSDWIWFLEQDFFFKNRNFIETIFKATDKYDAIGFWEANRLHPACLLVKRSIINNSRKDFGIVPNELDHFGKFSQDVVAELGLSEIGELHKLGLEMEKDWYHMQGLTHNYNLCRANDTDKIFKRDEFLTYNSVAPRIRTAQSPEFLKQTEEVAKQLGMFTPQLWLKEFWDYMQ